MRSGSFCILAMLLGGCQMFTPQPDAGASTAYTDTPSAYIGIGSCGPPSAVPSAEADSDTVMDWFRLQQTLQPLSPLSRWLEVLKQPADDPERALALVLVHSQADSPTLLRQLAQVQLQHLMPELSGDLRAFFNQVRITNKALLNRDRSIEQLVTERARLRQQIQSLSDELFRKAEQIEALTNIESELNGDGSGPAGEETPSRPAPDGGSDDD